MGDDSRLFLMVRNSLFQHKLPHNTIIHFPRIPIAHMIGKALCALLNFYNVDFTHCVHLFQLSQPMLPAYFAVLLESADHCAAVCKIEPPAKIFHAMADRKYLCLAVE